MQQKSSEAKEEYLRKKQEAKRVVRKVRKGEWIELVRLLQNDVHRNQRRFWKEVTKKNKSKEAGNVCDENGEVIDGKEILDRWKGYFGGQLCGVVS